MDVVWLKKDMRLMDHGPLSQVLTQSLSRRFAILYLYEPSQIQHPTAHGSHIHVQNEGLQELEASLGSLFAEGDQSSTMKDDRKIITILISEASLSLPYPSTWTLTLSLTRNRKAVDALESLHKSSHGPVSRVLSHLETGHMASYMRDKAVRRWCKANAVTWTEFNQTGVIRGLQSRVDIESKPFAQTWTDFMASKQHPDPREAPLKALVRSRLTLTLTLTLMEGGGSIEAQVCTRVG